MLTTYGYEPMNDLFALYQGVGSFIGVMFGVGRLVEIYEVVRSKIASDAREDKLLENFDRNVRFETEP